jgi:hypothetical protein
MWIYIHPVPDHSPEMSIGFGDVDRVGCGATSRATHKREISLAREYLGESDAWIVCRHIFGLRHVFAPIIASTAIFDVKGTFLSSLLPETLLH